MVSRTQEMRNRRLKVTVMIVILFILTMAIASLRARDWLGITVVFCIAMGLNFATLIVIATDLHDEIRLSALAYTICGWGWFLLVTLVPAIDGIIEGHLITPGFLAWLVPRPNPDPTKPDRAIMQSHILAHSLLSIAIGSLAAFAAWKVGQRLFDPDLSTTPTTGQS